MRKPAKFRFTFLIIRKSNNEKTFLTFYANDLSTALFKLETFQSWALNKNHFIKQVYTYKRDKNGRYHA
jgi:hypothetical protein